VNDESARAAHTTVAGLFRERARDCADRIAIEDARVCHTYAALNARVNRLAHALRELGVARGDRIGILSENRAEFIEVDLAAAKLGALVAALNWRLTATELRDCLALTQPKLLIASGRHAPMLDEVTDAARVIVLGTEYEALLGTAAAEEPPEVAGPEDGMLILFTSGTTGRPKGAVISQRALIYRMMVYRADCDIAAGDCFPAWTPLFHMGATDPSIATLLSGGTVVAVDGFDLDRLLPLLRERTVSWFVLLAGVMERFLERARAEALVPKGVRLTGVMADLVPRHQIAEVTRLLNAPFLNSFGSTETGMPPASAARIPPGVVPERLSKRQSSLCEIRLVDAEDREVAPGEAGVLAIRGPTLFSGYWQADADNTRDFRGGWFHTGDVFRRNPDGTLDFVDRAKYLIKSGGENIYPAEIEQVLLADSRVTDAVVVRQRDPRWGEVPVAVVVRADPALDEAALMARCNGQLARYKRPRRIMFMDGSLPRSFSGKVERREIEAWLEGKS
jgi:fatty-acyl-CoA synthase